MGLLDYYRQFDDMDHGGGSTRELRESARAREGDGARARSPTLDLSGTEWPDFPNSEVMNAAIFAARGRVNSYPDRHATEIRRKLAERHEVAPEQIVLGNGAAELLQSAAHAAARQGRRARDAVAVLSALPADGAARGRRGRSRWTSAAGASTPTRCAKRSAPRTRVVVLCNPNDPTGTYLTAGAWSASFASSLPEHVHLLIDEAYVEFQDAEPRDSVLRLVDAFPRHVVFRTFSKIYGLSGLRAGYAIGSPARDRLLGAIAPALGRQRADPGRRSVTR